MLCTRQITQHEATRSSVAVVVYLCGSTKVERGSSSTMAITRSFAPVAQPQNLDWLGPGS